MSGEAVEHREELGDALALEGVKKFAARLRCALLAWEALEQCLAKADPSKQ
jgi:nitrogen fixation NifU-like protein